MQVVPSERHSQYKNTYAEHNKQPPSHGPNTAVRRKHVMANLCDGTCPRCYHDSLAPPPEEPGDSRRISGTCEQNSECRGLQEIYRQVGDEEWESPVVFSPHQQRQQSRLYRNVDQPKGFGRIAQSIHVEAHPSNYSFCSK